MLKILCYPLFFEFPAFITWMSAAIQNRVDCLLSFCGGENISRCAQTENPTGNEHGDIFSGNLKVHYCHHQPSTFTAVIFSSLLPSFYTYGIAQRTHFLDFYWVLHFRFYFFALCLCSGLECARAGMLYTIYIALRFKKFYKHNNINNGNILPDEITPWYNKSNFVNIAIVCSLLDCDMVGTESRRNVYVWRDNDYERCLDAVAVWIVLQDLLD